VVALRNLEARGDGLGVGVEPTAADGLPGLERRAAAVASGVAGALGAKIVQGKKPPKGE